MFDLNELVVYGNSGLCVVSDIGALAMDAADKNKIYYTLTPVSKHNAHIYAPIDSSKVVLRSINTESECRQLIKDIPFIKPSDIEGDKDREKKYKSIIRTCDLECIVGLIKLLYLRRTNAEEQGRKLNNTDKNYLNQAEDALFSELTTVLDVAENDVKRLIFEHAKG